MAANRRAREHGGADLGECFAAASRIREPDAESWFDAWSELGAAVLVDAEKSLAEGHRTSARAANLRASDYFRASYTFLIGTPVHPRVVDAYRRQRAAFQSAIGLMRPSAQCVAIPYPGAALHGYLFRAADDEEPRPTLIISGGYDRTAAESYFFSGAAAVARG